MRGKFDRVCRRSLSPVRKPLFLILVLSVLAYLADLRTHVLRGIAMPDQPLALMGALIGMVLAFRTNLAYARWWEARVLWSQLVSASRTWLRQVKSFLAMADPQSGESAQKELILLQVAFVRALRTELNGGTESTEMLPFLPSPELREKLAGEPKPTCFLLSHMSRRISENCAQETISGPQFLALDRTLTRMEDVQGGCERIQNTPFPRQYDRFLELLTYTYSFLLPFGIADETGAWGVVISPFVALILLMLNQIGRNLENPFEDNLDSIPLAALSDNLERELLHAFENPAATRQTT
ncbi:bestrophin family protein [Verrucomicrobium sp. 3C]|uniref:bestrophin family protein n=1 Tax=Verrucomicrobium sp. 3C TaxID=1134055 RepID=UPI000368A412|nr:bestrophin family ion channel [Verrucomicrobium sp. 3C]